MTKMKMIRLYKDEDVPEHILQEVEVLTKKLGEALFQVGRGVPPNIVLSSFNRVHAALICSLIADHDLKNAAETEAIGLMKNVEHCSGKQLFVSPPLPE